LGWVLAFRSFSISLGKGVTVDSHRVSRVLGLLAFLGFSVRGGWQVAGIFRSVCRASDFEPNGWKVFGIFHLCTPDSLDIFYWYFFRRAAQE